MSDKMVISLRIDSSLTDYFAKAGHATEENAEACLVDFLANFLNDTRYPLTASRTGKQEILLSYRLKAFSDPIF